MIHVLFIAPGATVQDLGRDGFAAQGLGRAGAMDMLSHRIANMLLGNAAAAATVEIPLGPATLRLADGGRFALAGAACGATLAGRPLPRIWAGAAQAGDVLELGEMTDGASVTLALPGGVDVPEVLSSRSTQLREGFGGLQGRILMAGDILRATGPVQGPTLPQLSLTPPRLREDGQTGIALRALPSTEYEAFTAAAQDAFWSGGYAVTHNRNRQGYRLEGPMLDYSDTGELRSHGIGPGIVQVPGGGQPIIQLADSATMGGYPKIAAVIEPDLWRIAQARPGDMLRFVLIDLPGAAQAARDQQTMLDDLQAQIDDYRSRQAGWA